MIFYHLAVIWSPLTQHFFKILDPSLFHNMEKLSYTFSSGLAKCLLDLQILAGLTHMCTKYRAVRHVLAFLFKTCWVIGRPGGYFTHPPTPFYIFYIAYYFIPFYLINFILYQYKSYMYYHISYYHTYYIILSSLPLFIIILSIIINLIGQILHYTLFNFTPSGP